ncbi:MAG: hypothetical protein ACYDB7_14535 [Mycobacteriales bacterium]
MLMYLPSLAAGEVVEVHAGELYNAALEERREAWRLDRAFAGFFQSGGRW